MKVIIFHYINLLIVSVHVKKLNFLIITDFGFSADNSSLLHELSDGLNGRDSL